MTHPEREFYPVNRKKMTTEKECKNGDPDSSDGDCEARR